MSLIGIHISDVINAKAHSIIKLAENNNINLFQVFVSAGKNYGTKQYQDVLQYLKINDIYLLVHASYSINLARRWNEYDWWIHQFIGEITIAAEIKAFGIVVHTGKQLELTTAEALNNMYTSFLYIHSKTAEYQDVKIILETPTGQGSETLVTIEDFCKFMSKFYRHPDQKIRERFGVCIDTCHIFAAGHDIRTKKILDSFFKTINDTIGIDKIKVCHINDSKKGLGSKVDRHMNIGFGEIGEDPIRDFVTFIKRLEIPLVLETPSDEIENDLKIINSIK